MRRKYAKYGEDAISVVKFILAGLTIMGGINGMLAPLAHAAPMPLHFIYGTRVGLVCFGLVVVACGLTLIYGKVRRSRQWTGRGLMAVYCSFLFATLIQIAAFGFSPEYWLINAVCAVIAGALWLRWKFKTEYINPAHFRDDVINLR